MFIQKKVVRMRSTEMVKMATLLKHVLKCILQHYQTE